MTAHGISPSAPHAGRHAFLGGGFLRSRIPWPPDAADSPLNPGMEDLRRAADGSLPRLRFAFLFHALPVPKADALLREALRAARTVLIADLVLPERNLHVLPCLALRLLPGLNPLLALGPWRESARRTGEFLDSGALFGLLQRAGVHAVREVPLFAAAASLVAVTS